MDTAGRTGEEACKHAIILMARIAKNMTRKAKVNRTIQKDPRVKGPGGDYVEVRNQPNWDRVKNLYRLQYLKEPPDTRIGTWEDAKRIGRSAGLAQRAWLWGLRRLGANAGNARSPIRGVTRVVALRRGGVNGYVFTNSISYILKAMKDGWERACEQGASNQIMAQAARKMERVASARMRRRERTTRRSVESFFKVLG